MNSLSYYTQWFRGWLPMSLALITLGFWDIPCKQQPFMALFTLSLLALFLYACNRPILTVVVVLLILTQWSTFKPPVNCKANIAANWLTEFRNSVAESHLWTSQHLTPQTTPDLNQQSQGFAKEKSRQLAATVKKKGEETFDGLWGEDGSNSRPQQDFVRKKRTAEHELLPKVKSDHISLNTERQGPRKQKSSENDVQTRTRKP